MIRCCIFDLDGTLLDTLDTITYYVNRQLRSVGLSEITKDECKCFVGDGPEKLIRRALSSRGYENEGGVSRILEKYKADYDAEPLYLTRPYEGICDMLRQIKDAGLKTAVISNKQHESAVPAVRRFFGDLIDIVCGSRPGVPLKPAPDATVKIMSELGVEPSEVAYIGDTGVDMKTGKAIFAAKTIGVEWGFRERTELEMHGADAIVANTDELCTEILS